MNLNRQSGVHGVNAALWAVSPGFDSSDAGFTFMSDRAGMHAVYQWRNPKVNRLVRNRFVAVAKFYTWNFGRELQSDGVFTFGNAQFKNYWTVFGNAGYFRRDAGRPRDARRAVDGVTAGAHGGSVGVESDSRKRTQAVGQRRLRQQRARAAGT